MPPNPPKRTLRYWKTMCESIGVINEELRADLSRAHADTEMAQAQAKKAEQDLKVVFDDSNRIIDQLNEQKRETARVLDLANGMSEERDRLKEELQKEHDAHRRDTDTYHRLVSEHRTQPPPRAKWSWGEALIGFGLCGLLWSLSMGYHSKPKPVPVTIGYQNLDGSVVEVVPASWLSREHSIRMACQQDYRQQQQTIKACKAVEKRHGEMEGELK